ncbi:branched-chain amino acid ABC transporter permease [Pseudonocardia sp. GCM10023141]|uniref:branched-chain amino acid ABC transporter permease n=1 Tax=Pseudonocardia sp. GCM10023141 TaxID=3252653 RepID=UPI00361A79C4
MTASSVVPTVTRSTDPAVPLGRRTGGRPWAGPVVMAAILVGLLAVGPGSLMNVAITAFTFAIAAQGLTVLAGPVGVVSIGSSAFVGAGAFVTAYFVKTAALDLLPAMILGILVCGVLGLAAAPIAGKLSGIQIAIITVGLSFLAQYVFQVATPFTGGGAGLQLDAITVAGHDLNAPLRLAGVIVPVDSVFLTLTTMILLLTTVATTNLLKSRTGRALYMTGTSAIGARTFGIDPARYRAIAFIYAAVLGGLAGGLLASRQGFISWEQFGIAMSINLIAVIVLGGLGSVYGAIAGAVVVYALPEVVKIYADVLPFVSISSSGLTPERATAILYGLLLVVITVLEPAGLAGVHQRLARRARRLIGRAKT